MSETIPSERELDILKALWQLGEGTVRLSVRSIREGLGAVFGRAG